MTIDRELRSSLHHTGEHIVIDAGSLADVKARGRKRKTIRQGGLAVCAVLVGVGGGVVGLRALDDPSTDVIVGTEEVILEGTVDADSEAAEVTADMTTPAALTISWEQVPASSVVGYRRAFVSSDGQFAALSTAPGPVDWSTYDHQQNGYLYRSNDGIDWEAIEVPDGLGVTDLAFVDGQLIAVGTAATAGLDPVTESPTDPGSIVIAYPDDNWRTENLPLDLASMVPDFGTVGEVAVVTAEVGDTNVVAVTVNAYLDVYGLLGDRAPTGENEYAYLEGDEILHVRFTVPDEAEWPGESEAASPATTVPTDEDVIATEAGEDVVVTETTVPYGEDVVVARYPLAELGFDAADIAAFTNPPVLVFADGEGGFTEVARVEQTAPGPLHIQTTGDVAILVVGDADDGSATYSSIDGRTWTPLEIPRGFVVDAVAGGLGIAVTGFDGNGNSSLAFSADGQSWNESLVLTSNAYVTAVVVGDSLMAVSVDEWQEPEFPTEPIEVVLADGSFLSIDPETSSGVVMNAAGERIGEFAEIWMSAEAGEIVLDDGSTLPVTIDAVSQAFDEAYPVDDCCDAQSWIYTSSDGVTWERSAADDLFDVPVVGVAVQAITPAGVIVRASALGDDPTVRDGLDPLVVLGRIG